MAKFKISRTDGEADFAENKLTAGEGVTITKVSDGGYETLEFSANAQVTNITSEDGYEVKVSSSDSEPNFLANKIVAGSNIEITTVSNGGVETLQISATDQIDESLIGAFQDGYTVKVSGSDGLADFLSNKLVAGNNLTITTVSSGGVETLRLDVTDQIDESLIGAFQDGYTVKVTNSDTAASFLYNKLVAGDNVTLTVVSDGGQETLRIDVTDQIDESLIGAFQDGYTSKVSSSDTQANFLENKLIAGSNITITRVSNGGVETLQFDVTDQIDESLIGAFQDGYTIKVTGDDTQVNFLANKLTAGNNVELTVVSCGGDETLRIDVVDQDFSQIQETIEILIGPDGLDGYASKYTEAEHYHQLSEAIDLLRVAADGYGQGNTEAEHYHQLSEAIDLLRQAADGYGQGGTEAEHYHQQQEINTEILLALDGYAQNSTVTENKNAQQQINQSVIQALDGYNLAITEHENAQQQINQSVIQALDGYNVAITEHYNQQQQINQSIIQSIDGYQLQINGIVTTETEHYNQLSNIAESIVKDLDGYNQTISEHYRQHSVALDNIRYELDGYNQTITENKNAQQQINQTIIKELDGYDPGNVSENLIPSVDNTYNIGSTSKRWKSLHLGEEGVHLEYDGQYVNETRLIQTFVSGISTTTNIGSAVTLGLNDMLWLKNHRNGNLYLSKGADLAIDKITPAGSVSTILNSSSLFSAGGIDVDQDEILYIADYEGGLIHKWNGSTLTTLTSALRPTSVAINKGMNRFAYVRVGDGGEVVSGNGFQQSDYIDAYGFNPDTKTLDAYQGGVRHPDDAQGGDDLNRGFLAITFGDDNTLFATTTDSKVYKINLTTFSLTLWADLSTSSDYSSGIACIAADVHNVCYVTCNNSMGSAGIGHYIVKIDSDGRVEVIAGDGVSSAGGYGDGGPALTGRIEKAIGITIASNPFLDGYEAIHRSVVYFTDGDNNAGLRIRYLPFDFETNRSDFNLTVDLPTQKLHLINDRNAGISQKILTVTEDGYVGINAEDPVSQLTVGGVLSLGNFDTPVGPVDGYGRLWVNTDNILYFRGGDGALYNVLDKVLEATFQENKNAQYQINQSIIQSLDGYNLAITEHQNAQYQVNQSIIQALDGYNLNITEHYNQQNQINQSIIQNLDGYAQNWADASQQIQGLRDVLDADAYVDSLTFHENKEQQYQINQSIIQALDGYNLNITEHYNQLSNIAESIVKDLDGYNQTISEHYRQHSDAIDNIRYELDGYNVAITEHYNQQQQINQSIIQALNDGYADVQEGADGYVAFFTGPTSMAGDNDLFWDRENNRLGIHTQTPAAELEVVGTLKTTNITITNGAAADYVLTSDASGVGSWQTFDVAFATMLVSRNDGNIITSRNDGEPVVRS